MVLQHWFNEHVLPLFVDVSALDSVTILLINRIFALTAVSLAAYVLLVVPTVVILRLCHYKGVFRRLRK